MADRSKGESVAAAMRRINDAWLARRVDDLADLVHPEIVVVVPGFAGRSQGRERFLAGFRDFIDNAIVHDFRQEDDQVDAVGQTGVVSFRYQMLYERSGQRYRATGRDLWVFEKTGERWLAVWRAMLDLNEVRA
jgi:ketosteroid isomerase-like protein